MTTAETPARVRYAGNNLNMQLSTVFTFLANSHVRAIRAYSNGYEQFLTEGVEYTLTGANTGTPGTLSTTFKVPSTDTITIMRDVPFSQDFNGEVLGNANAQDLETSYDKIWHGMQELKDGVDRSLKAVTEGGGVTENVQAWSPIFALIEGHTNIDEKPKAWLQVINWFGGSGPIPPTGMYIGLTGFVDNVNSAVNLRGQDGASGAGSAGGDVVASNNLSDLWDKRVARDNLSLWSTDIAAEAFINLNVASGDLVKIIGNSADPKVISQFALNEGHARWCVFQNKSILQSNTNIILPTGGIDIEAQNGDWALIVGLPGNEKVWVVSYMCATGRALKEADAGSMGFGSAAYEDISAFLQPFKNLSEITSPGAARANLGLGSSATLNAGLAINDVVQLIDNQRLPALDAGYLYNFPPITGNQPTPTSSVYAPGTFMVMTTTFASIPNGNQVSGTALRLPVWGLDGNIKTNDVIPTGTWTNVSGDIVGSDASIMAGYFVRKN